MSLAIVFWSIFISVVTHSRPLAMKGSAEVGSPITSYGGKQVNTPAESKSAEMIIGFALSASRIQGGLFQYHQYPNLRQTSPYLHNAPSAT